jgi:hypothetical protein
MEVLLDSSQDGSQVGVEPVYPVFTPPLPLNEATVQQACQVMGDTALFKPKFLPNLAYVVGLGTKQLHDGKPRRIGKRPEEFPIESS